MSIEREILAASAAWDAALVANEPEMVASFMADDWVYVGPSGPIAKADLIGRIATDRLRHDSMELVGQPRVAVVGDAAILTSHKASTGSWNGVPYAADEWISEVFVRRHGRWVCVLSHKCPAEPATG